MGRAFLGWTIRHKAGCWKYQKKITVFSLSCAVFTMAGLSLVASSTLSLWGSSPRKLVGQRIIDKNVFCWLLPKHYDVLYSECIEQASKSWLIAFELAFQFKIILDSLKWKGVQVGRIHWNFKKPPPIDNFCVLFSTWCSCLGLVKWYFQPKQKRKQVW